MKSAPKDLLKEYIQSQQFNSTAEIMQAMKEMFRDVIEQVMEEEMDDELWRERCQRSEGPEGQVKNYRNGYSKKTVKTQLGEVEIKVPRDRQGNYEPKIIGKYDRIFFFWQNLIILQNSGRSCRFRSVARSEKMFAFSQFGFSEINRA